MIQPGGLRGAAPVALALGLSCTSPLAQGEARYREGDWLEALEIWRSIPSDSSNHETARLRVEAVESEFEQLVVRYKQRGRYFERSGRLAESILNYRLALKLQPDDRQTLAHVQKLARELAHEEEKLREALYGDLEEQQLGGARQHLVALRRLDPFDPTLESQERELEERIHVEVERVLGEGRKQFRRGELKAAEGSLRAVLELDPQNESAHGYLSYLATVQDEAQRSGLRPAALHHPERFATEAEIRAEGLHQNALAAERAGDPWRAIGYELRALSVHPEHAEAGRNLVRLRARLAPEVEKLIESGRTYFRQEDLQSALDQWRRALLVDPKNARAREYAARAERMLENLERLRSEPPGRVGAR
jgi:tetratricopeptide (TPR) repeat protein